MPVNTGRTPVVLDLANGSSIQATLQMKDSKLVIDVSWFGYFVVEPKSAADLAQHILKITEGVISNGVS